MATGTPTPSQDSTSTGADAQVRLPRNVTPLRYELRLEPDVASAAFGGSARIELEVEEETATVVCNAVELDVTNAVFSNAAGSTVAATVSLDGELERVTFAVPEPLAQGRWELSVSFSGVLNDKLRGFYRSSFESSDSSRAWIATTQFEATDARRAFPCWDEPDRKAVFAVTLVTLVDELAISNGSVVQTTPLGDGRMEVVFAETIPMSTYLVAFVVGPLEQTDPVEVGGVKLSVVHVPGKGHLSEFCLEAARHALEFFTDWFSIPYPSDKLDLIAIPDFAFGAMENLGAVTFRESVLLVDPAQASRTELERVATVVSHEIAHMWFGDLVTMKWWNGLWLNEAFATFMEVLCVDHFRPEWQMWAAFAQERDDAMAVDGLPGTRPIEYPVRTAADAEDMFDRLTYEKGGAVLRMLERYLGAERFRDGIRAYITKHSYSNAETTDLWDAIEQTTGEPVRAIMDTWIFQGGHPLVTVSREAGSTVLSQAPFSYLGGDRGNIGESWQVPMRMRTLGGPRNQERRLVLGAQTLTVQEGPLAVANAGGSGVYRTIYAGELMAELTESVWELDAAERSVLVSDTWAAALSGAAALSEWTALVRKLAGDDDPHLWGSVIRSLSLLDHMAHGEGEEALGGFCRELLGPVLARVGLAPSPEGEDPLVGTLRARLVSALGTIGADPAIRAWAQQHFAASRDGEWAIGPDLIRPALTCVAAADRAGDYETFLDRYHNPSTPQDELRYLYSLVDFPSEALLERTLALVETEVRSQNAYPMYSLALASKVHGLATWRRVVAAWDEIVARLPSNALGRLIGGIEAQASSDLAREVESFLTEHEVPSGQRQAVLSLQRLRSHASFAERERDSLAQSLATTPSGPRS